MAKCLTKSVSINKSKEIFQEKLDIEKLVNDINYLKNKVEHLDAQEANHAKDIYRTISFDRGQTRLNYNSKDLKSMLRNYQSKKTDKKIFFNPKRKSNSHMYHELIFNPAPCSMPKPPDSPEQLCPPDMVKSSELGKE